MRALLRSCLWASLAAMAWPASCLAAITSLDDIQYWIGSGANRAGVVLDWNGDSLSDVSLAWGFRWDGVATGEDMLRAAITADSRLFAKLGANGSLGLAVRGLGYDLNADGLFAIDDGTAFDADGIAPSGPADGALSVDPADLYREGWFTGVWNYATANTDPLPTGAWHYSMQGATSRALVDGAWDSWAFTATFHTDAFAANASAAPPPLQAADFDANGGVDGADFLRWQQGLGILSGATAAQGDATGDGAVTAADLATWKMQFCAGAAVGAAAVITTVVPEPDTALSLSTCASAMLFFLSRVMPPRRRVS